MSCSFGSLKTNALSAWLGFDVKNRCQGVHAIAYALTGHDRLELTQYVPLTSGRKSTRAKERAISICLFVVDQMHRVSTEQMNSSRQTYADADGLQMTSFVLSRTSKALKCWLPNNRSAEASTIRIQNTSATNRCAICSQIGANKMTFIAP